MRSTDLPTFLHIANGGCTTRLIEAAGLPGERSIWADPLYEGPVPGGLDDDGMVEIRARHLAAPDAGASSEVARDLREWRRVLAEHPPGSEIVLWFEHDLFDQLNLIHLLSWIRAHLPRAVDVRLISIGSFPGRANFQGFGELTPAEIAPLLATRQAVTDAQYRLAERAWHAFGAPSPEGLDRLRREDLSALPFLAAALGRFLEEYPWTAGGLSRSERRLLELASAGPIDLRRALPHMQQGEHAYYITDSSLRGLAEECSSAATPLLTFDRRAGSTTILDGTVATTNLGRAVLAGEKDRVTECGIDRWLGGVHLHGDHVWRWDSQRDRVTHG